MKQTIVTMLPEVFGVSVLTSAEVVPVALVAKVWIAAVDESVVVVDMLVIWPGVVILDGCTANKT